MKEKTTFKKDFRFEPFQHIVVGDPMYVENYPKGSKDYKRLVADFKNPKKNCFGFLRISEKEYDDEGIKWGGYEVDIVTVPFKEAAEVYLDGKRYTRASKEEVQLGCDTACFSIEVDEDWEEFHTGADGYYGSAFKYSVDKVPYGIHINLFVDKDMYDYDTIYRKLDTLFELRTAEFWKAQGKD